MKTKMMAVVDRAATAGKAVVKFVAAYSILIMVLVIGIIIISHSYFGVSTIRCLAWGSLCAAWILWCVCCVRGWIIREFLESFGRTIDDRDDADRTADRTRMGELSSRSWDKLVQMKDGDDAASRGAG